MLNPKHIKGLRRKRNVFDACESSSPGCGDDLIVARYVSKTTVLWNQTDTVGSSGAGKSKILQQGHKEDKKLHPSQRLANTRSFPCEETREGRVCLRANSSCKSGIGIAKRGMENRRHD